MADSCADESSNINVENHTTDWDLSIIAEAINSKSIIYDGKRVKWCKDYKSLQVFTESAFCIHGKWRSIGGHSKKFDATNGELSMIWYPGKLNTLTLNGKIGEQVKQHLIDSYILSTSDDFENTENVQGCCVDLRECIENLSLEVEILRSRVDSLQFLDDSQIKTGDLCNKIAGLEIDLEEEKLKNMCLEREINCLKDEIMIIKSFRCGSVVEVETIDSNNTHYSRKSNEISKKATKTCNMPIISTAEQLNKTDDLIVLNTVFKPCGQQPDNDLMVNNGVSLITESSHQLSSGQLTSNSNDQDKSVKQSDNDLMVNNGASFIEDSHQLISGQLISNDQEKSISECSSRIPNPGMVDVPDSGNSPTTLNNSHSFVSHLSDCQINQRSKFNLSVSIDAHNLCVEDVPDSSNSPAILGTSHSFASQLRNYRINQRSKFNQPDVTPFWGGMVTVPPDRVQLGHVHKSHSKSRSLEWRNHLRLVRLIMSR